MYENGNYVNSAKLPITDVLRLDHVDEMQCAIEAREITSKHILTNQSLSDYFSYQFINFTQIFDVYLWKNDEDLINQFNETKLPSNN